MDESVFWMEKRKEGGKTRLGGEGKAQLTHVEYVHNDCGGLLLPF